MIGVVNYNMGNITNVVNALRTIGFPSQLVSSVEQLDTVEKLILPGVGAFGAMMNYLDDYDLIDPIRDWIHDDRPFFGICLGYQALFPRSEENEGIEGLGILSGTVRRVRGKKVPHIGWNEVLPSKNSGVFTGGYFYFVHSYIPSDVAFELIAATTHYFEPMVSAIEWNNIYACQFHPEKSGKEGLALLKRWARC